MWLINKKIKIKPRSEPRKSLYMILRQTYVRHIVHVVNDSYYDTIVFAQCANCVLTVTTK